MPDWTNEQKTILESSGNTLVYASAGSGKTAVMVEKIIRDIADGIPIEKILVLSYTNASATDMKLKIVEQLSALIKDNKELSQKLLEQFDNLNFASIGTMDSFLLKIIRENFERLNVSPTLTQMDEIESDELKHRVLYEVMSHEYDKENADYKNVMSKMSGIVDDTPITNVILKLYESMSIKPHPEEFLKLLEDSVTENPDSLYGKIIINYYKEVAKEALPYAERLLTELTIDDSSPYKTRIRECIGYIRDVSEISDAESVKKIAENCLIFSKVRDNSLLQEDKDLIEVVKKFVEGIYKELKSNLLVDYTGYNIAETKEFISVVIRLVKEFDKCYKEEKAKLLKLDFNDLSRLAIKLLSDENVANEIRKKYDLVFVDEYQDINPLQEEILLKLTRDNLFMVGDIKQSIYAFRNADAKIFADKKDEFERGNGGVALPMTKNFRSEDGILKFVDSLFSGIMSKNVGGVNYKDESLFLKEDVNINIPVEIDIYNPIIEKTPISANGVYSVKNHKENMDETRGCDYIEGMCVAKKIKELIGTKHKVKENIEEIKYSDIAILFRKRSGGADGFLEALEDAGIPTISDGFIENAGNRYVKELNSLLRAMSNAHEDIPFTGYLLSYFGAFLEDEIQEIRSKTQNKHLIKGVEEICNSDNPLSSKCKSALDFLNHARDIISYKTPAEFLEEIVNTTGFNMYCSSGIDGIEGYHAVRAYIDNVAKMGDTLEEVLSYIDNAGIPKIYAECDGFENAVNIITVHGSKGLEYPIVFLARTDAPWKSMKDGGDIIFDKDLGAGLKIYNEDTRSKIKSLSYNAIGIKNKKEEVDENIRLLYVALTRAKEKLFITSCKKSGLRNLLFPIPTLQSGSFLDLILMGAGNSQVVKNRIIVEDVSFEKHDVENFAKYIVNKGDDTFIDEYIKVFDFKYQYIKSVSISPKYSVTVLNRIDNTSDVSVPYIVTGESDKRRIGIAYHSVFENIDLSINSLSEVNVFINEMVDKGLLQKGDADLIDSKLIFNAINSPLIKEGIGGQYIREKSFMLRVKASDVGLDADDEVLVQGTIDLAFFGEKNIIVDFKYSTLSDEDLIKKYKKQLLLYKLAVEKSTGKKEDDVYLYSIRCGHILKI